MPRPPRVSDGAARLRAPAMTPEDREDQMVALAFDLVEKRLREGTASAQETVHFLKFGSSRERLERDRLMSENALLRQKTESLQSSKNVEALYKDAIRAMKTYTGNGRGDEDEED